MAVLEDADSDAVMRCSCCYCCTDAVLLLTLQLAVAEAEDADSDERSRLPDAVLLMIQDWQASKHCQADDAVLVLLLPTALVL